MHALQPLSARSLLFPCVVLVALLASTTAALAGGPGKVAGITGFDPGVKGQPLTWAGGILTYYTDQGGLGVLSSSDADALVAEAFSRWTSISAAAVSASRAGQLAEDVSGTNVTDSSSGITIPPDIQPTATDKPVAIVYDSDGQVTDALLGSGSSYDCLNNAAYGGTDNFSSAAHFRHALVVLNGVCVPTADQVPDLRYRLVRTLGRVLGLAWSQVNVNVQSGVPVARSADKAGFPLMHVADFGACVTIALCLPNADQPRMDDRAALSRLYPVTAQNVAQFPGKQVLADATARIHGDVRFASTAGLSGQPMQGVNVVARWIDPATGQPSRTYAASSVSGFLFRGNAGNPITGYTDPSDIAYDRFGSDDPTVEGFFDLAGLEFPDGQNTAQYQLEVEAVDGLYSEAVEPYGPWQVQPSGSFAPVVITLTKGSDVTRDIEMTGTPGEAADQLEPNPFDTPIPVPAAGDWIASLSGYGDADFYRFVGQANRTLSVEVTALDETGAPTQSKAMPVIGMWSLSAPSDAAPGAASPPQWSGTFGTVRLDAQLNAATDFRIGIADLRGDGRPDYRYQMRVFYGDTIFPTRLPMSGGVVSVTGYGFRTNTQAQAGYNAEVISVAPNRLLLRFPPMDEDARSSLTLTDPATGASSVLTNALTCGAAPDDRIVFASSVLPAVPVGGQTESPVRFQVLAADGTTPVAGATVQLQASSGATLDACGGSASCFLLSDGSGRVSTNVFVQAAGTLTVTATLAPASYSPPATAQTTIVGTSSSTDITLVAGRQSIAQGAVLDLPLTARVLTSGTPQTGKTVNFFITAGSATLSGASAITASDGYATTTLHLNPMTSDVQVSACVAPGNSPCRTFMLTAARPTHLRVEPVSGTTQVLRAGEAYQPVVVRVTDDASPPHAVRAAAVTFSSITERVDEDVFTATGDETIAGNFAMPILLGSAQAIVASDANGLANWTPPTQAVSDFEVEGSASVASGASVSFEMEVLGRASQGQSQGQKSGAAIANSAGANAASEGNPQNESAPGAVGVWLMPPEVPEQECHPSGSDVEKRNKAGAEIPSPKETKGCNSPP
jgi:hypothetical protein